MRYADVILDADQWEDRKTLIDVHAIGVDLETRGLKVRRVVLLRRGRPDRFAPGIYVHPSQDGLNRCKNIEYIQVPKHCMTNSYVLGVLSERLHSGQNVLDFLHGGSKTMMDLMTQTSNPLVRMGLKKVLSDQDDDGRKDEAILCVFGTDRKPFSKSAAVQIGYTDIYLFQDTSKYSIERHVEASESSRTTPDDYSDAQSVT